MSLTRYLELRSLVDVLYDIQDVRMRTANRLRLMPKETAKLKVNPLLGLEKQLTDEIDVILQSEPIYNAFLGKVRGVGPRISGSIIAQTMIRFEKISEEEYKALKKHHESHVAYDTHVAVASHMPCDTHTAAASQTPRDNHIVTASHESDDTHVVFAYSLEQFSLAQKTENGCYLIPVKRGIEAFDTVSKYWAWWGLHVVDGHAAKRKRGENINWNPKMRTLSWKIGKQFVMQGRGYRQIYDQEKDRLTEQRLPLGECQHYEECKAKLKTRKTPACKGHIDAMAKRKTVKLFLSHLWQTWRQLEQQPTRPPYVMEYMGHNGTVSPEKMLETEQ